MANKAQTTASNNKKPGKTLKEKRAAKHVKQEAQTATRKSWENK